MSARHKLNAVSVQGSLLAAAFVGLLCQSWGVFWLLALVLLAGALHSGDIRPRGRRR